MADPEPRLDRRGSPTLAGRLVTWYTITVLVVVLGVGFGVDRLLTAAVRTGLVDSLSRQAQAVGAVARGTGDDPQSLVNTLAEETGLRLTLIGDDGTVLADSETVPGSMENHLDRPEVAAALAGLVGSATRESETAGEPFLFVAIPPEDGVVVRAGLPLSDLQAVQSRVRASLVLAGIGVAAVGMLLVWLVSRRLSRPLESLTDSVRNISEGELDTRVAPSRVVELARLGTAVNRMADELGSRLGEAEAERERRDQVLATMTEGVVLVEGDDRVAFANKAAERLIGVPPVDLSGLVPHALQRMVRTARASGEVVEEEIQHGRPILLFKVAAIPLGDKGGTLLVMRDMTEQRRVEAMRYSFVADASHELKTPVAGIQAAMETLQQAVERDPVTAKRLAKGAEASAIRLGRIVSDLLDLSRLESALLEPKEVDLSALVAEEVTRAHPQASEAGIALTERLEPVTIEGEPDDLALAVRNLIDNAVRYTDPGGRVLVRLHEVDGAAVIEVEDTGVGIPTRELPRVFERFYRVDVSRSRATGGTGLGLSIVRHVAERHGGTVEAESQLGRGSTFRLILPSST